MLKNYEKPERLAVLNESLNNVQNSDFQNNMKKDLRILEMLLTSIAVGTVETPLT